MNPEQQITLNVTLNEVEGILAGLGELPSKTGAFPLIMKIQAQVQFQLPKTEEAKAEEPKAE